MYANKVIHILLNYIHVFFYSVFIGVSERQETETTIRKLKIKKKIDKDLENYRKWIQRSRNVYMLLPSLVPRLFSTWEGPGYEASYSPTCSQGHRVAGATAVGCQC